MIIMMGAKLQSPPPTNLSDLEKNIYDALLKSEFPHQYQSWKHLRFELLLRKNIIEAANKLAHSSVEFKVFQDSKFNPRYWTKTQGGYLLNPFVLPSQAIEDIFQNGQEYSFECSTAIVVIYYYAVLNSINLEAFNRIFPNLLVWDWSYDEDLRIITKVGTDFIPGDVLYFHNPDYLYPVWIGENAVYFGDDQYFGHGIGIKSKEEMIRALNTLRKPNAQKSAYLLSQYSRLDFLYLSQFSY
ncbi:protein-glutamine gamma-glutamyltransferase [Robertmurraya siralis]|uniref:Protein-glutamine gamma-glutamyltransferase n=1 Tax=Robertmurraya siralis TaxID=77777 RepID=A0A920BSN1_9BACI|nr:protein-glutamine gamma-glutamyltransferase [Robertmurraya siralis]GIN61265.1 protein-glutamine gamma-glutamyltransferase [Robertmurraya siralis]